MWALAPWNPAGERDLASAAELGATDEHAGCKPLKKWLLLAYKKLQKSLDINTRD
jgi:hypothetical protein